MRIEMSDKKGHDSTEDLRSDYQYKTWPEDQLTREARQRSVKIEEIPVSEEILKETAAYVLAHPPKLPSLKTNTSVSVPDLREAIFQAVLSATRRGEIIWQRQGISYDQHPAFEANYRGVHIEIYDGIKKISFSVNRVEFPHINPHALWAYMDKAKSWDPRWETEESETIISVLQAP